MKWLLGVLLAVGLLGGISACSHEQVKTVDEEKVRQHSSEAMDELQQEEDRSGQTPARIRVR